MHPVKLFLANEQKDSSPKLPFMLKAPEYFSFTGFTVVPEVEQADFVVIPASPRHFSSEYLLHVRKTIEWAKAKNKQTVCFIGGDYAYKMHIDGAIVFKTSAFAHERHKGEIVAPTSTDDPYHKKEFVPRAKRSRPVVSFCGFAELSSPLTWAKYIFTNSSLDIGAVLLNNPNVRAHKRGIYFRRKAMALLKKNAHIETQFILRSSFFGQAAKEDSPHFRQEYLDNMRDSDFALAPRGDGNYSRRFFRALSMGVIPILIDTDMVLPMERQIDYDKFIVRVPHAELHTLPSRVVELYDSLTDQEFMDMQLRAREMFNTYLRQDAFYSKAFAILKEQGPDSL